MWWWRFFFHRPGRIQSFVSLYFYSRVAYPKQAIIRATTEKTVIPGSTRLLATNRIKCQALSHLPWSYLVMYGANDWKINQRRAIDKENRFLWSSKKRGMYVSLERLIQTEIIFWESSASLYRQPWKLVEKLQRRHHLPFYHVWSEAEERQTEGCESSWQSVTRLIN